MERPTGFGVCLSPQDVWENGRWIVEQALALLTPPWYLTWGVDDLAPASGVPHMPMVYNAQHMTGRMTDRLAVGGDTWLLLNEPERPEQANMRPDEAAALTRQFFTAAWAAGKEFQWAAPGVSVNMADHNGMLWLTEYAKLLRRNCGISRPTYWHIHGYRSRNVNDLKESMAEFWRWYDTWGACAPVVLSEVCAEGAALPDQIAIMDEVREMLRFHEIAGAAWFLANRIPYSGGATWWPTAALCSIDYASRTVSLTELGQHYLEIK